MLKGLIGKKVGMTQIFDDAGAAIPVTIDRSWAMLCNPGAHAGSQMVIQPCSWVSMKSSQSASRVVNSGTSSATISLRCAFCASFAPKNPELKEGEKVTVSMSLLLARRWT